MKTKCSSKFIRDFPLADKFIRDFPLVDKS